MKIPSLFLLAFTCFSLFAQPVRDPTDTRPELPMMWMETTMRLRVPVADVGVYDFKLYVFLDAEAGRIRSSSAKPDEFGIITSHIRPEILAEAGDPPSYLLMGFNTDGERYYNIGIASASLGQVIAALSTSRIEVTGVRHSPFYEYENASARDITVTLAGERLSPLDVYQAISAQTGCEIVELPNGTLTVTGCS